MLRIDVVSLMAAGMLAALAQGALAQAESGGAQSVTGIRLTGDLPIQIESDKLEVLDQNKRAVFTGNVNVVQGKMQMKSGVMTVYYLGEVGAQAAGSSAIDRIEVSDKVYVKSENQVATGDKGTFDMKTEVLVLTGKEVVMSEGPNVLVGCRLTVQMKSGRAQVDGCAKGDKGGRVMMSITPGSAPQ